MALARVVSFEGVDSNRMAEMKQQIEQGERPDDIPASEIMILHDREAEKSLAIVLFETEDDYRQGDETLSSMDPPGDGMGNRASVTKFEVAVDVRA